MTTYEPSPPDPVGRLPRITPSIRLLRRLLFAGVLAALLIATQAAAVPGVASARSAWDCPSGGNPGLWAPTSVSTVARTSLFGRTFELRRHAGTVCSWGRVSGGSPGDSVWVDWSTDGGRNWRQLSVTRIPSRGTQVYTQAHNHAGAQMRACGKAGNRPDVVCTGWAS